MDVLGIPLQAWLGQLVLGLVNGAFYAVLSLGLAVIFGLLNVVNFAHGAIYTLGAYGAWIAFDALGVGYFWSLVLVPVAVGVLGVIIERLMLRRLHDVDHVYGMLLTFGIALLIEGLLNGAFGAAGQPYPVPAALASVSDLGFMVLPDYRAWVVGASLAACFATWFVIERTSLGSVLRAAIENGRLVQAFGINVPLIVMMTYGAGMALAAFAGVLAAPINQISPLMGGDLIILVFAVVVIGGMGSILGAIVTGLGLGVAEGVTKVIYPEASTTIIFVIMAFVLLLRPSGLFGQEA